MPTYKINIRPRSVVGREFDTTMNMMRISDTAEQLREVANMLASNFGVRYTPKGEVTTEEVNGVLLHYGVLASGLHNTPDIEVFWGSEVGGST